MAELTCWVVALGAQLTEVPACAMLKGVVVELEPEPVNAPVVG